MNKEEKAIPPILIRLLMPNADDAVNYAITQSHFCGGTAM